MVLPQIGQYFFDFSPPNAHLQVMIEVRTDTFLLQALEVALQYFIELNPEHRITDSTDIYDVYASDERGNPSGGKIDLETKLHEIRSHRFVLVARKKSTLLTLLRQPVK